MEQVPGLTPYQQIVRELSERLVELQRPIRILDAIKWDNDVQQAFFASKCKELPPVTLDYYANRPLGFDPEEKRRQFQDLVQDIQRLLGQFNPIGVILRRMCREYEMVVYMLEGRGKPEFSRIARELFGSASDAFHAGDPSLADLGDLMGEALQNIHLNGALKEDEKIFCGEDAVQILQEQLNQDLADPQRPVRVMLSDGIVADAAAGADYIKIRKEACFSERDLRLLRIHEGWVHLGTTLNGMNQPICTFLSKGPPSSTLTQEGLAILMEIIAFASHPDRVLRLTNRIRAVAMAEAGANFIEVYEFFREQGRSEDVAYNNTQRVFRGSTPDGGPFTKDLTYSKGFILVYNYVRLAVRKGLLDRIPLLFCGKTTLEDMRILAQLREEKMITMPRYLPPQFSDMSALTSWMCYSNFLNRLNLQRIEADYASIF